MTLCDITVQIEGSVPMVPVLTAPMARVSTAPTYTYNDTPLRAPTPVLSTLLHRASEMPMAPQRADSHPHRSAHPLRLTTAALTQIPAQHKSTAQYSPLSRLYAGYAKLTALSPRHSRAFHSSRSFHTTLMTQTGRQARRRMQDASCVH